MRKAPRRRGPVHESKLDAVHVREPQLSPAFSDDAELVLAYARRGRTWADSIAAAGLATKQRFRPCISAHWGFGRGWSGTITRIPRAL